MEPDDLAVPNQALVTREAVGIFDDEPSMQAAIDELLTAGFGRCELSFGGAQTGAEASLSARQLADDPNAHRTNQFSPEVLGDAEGSLIGGFAVIPVLGASWAAGAAGAGLIATAGVAIASGGAGALIGLGVAYAVARRRRQGLATQSAHGGLLLWIRTRTVEMEERAQAIMRRHAAHDVHSHDLLPLTSP